MNYCVQIWNRLNATINTNFKNGKILSLQTELYASHEKEWQKKNKPELLIFLCRYLKSLPDRMQNEETGRLYIRNIVESMTINSYISCTIKTEFWNTGSLRWFAYTPRRTRNIGKPSSKWKDWFNFWEFTTRFTATRQHEDKEKQYCE
jgi:hypothetical protein